MSEVDSTEKKCPFEGCDKPIYCRGLCTGHYQQQLAGKSLRPLKVKNPDRPTCSICGEPATITFKETYCCVIHYRMKQMRYDAQASGKTIPTNEELVTLFRLVIETGMKCPACRRTMNGLEEDAPS